MKKILFILHFPPPIHGSSIVGQCIKNSTIINNSFKCRYVNLLVSRTMNEAGKPSFIKVIRFIGIWFNVLFEIIRKKPDLCYLALTVSGTAFYKDALLVVLLRIFRIKCVYHLHNKGIRQVDIKKTNDLIYRFVFRKADIILLSKQLYSDIEAYVPALKVHICPNGIVDTTINSKAQLLPTKKPVKILFLSNLLELKGIFILLDACYILKKRKIEFECNIIGAEGDLNTAQFNEKIMQKQLSGYVNYLGKKYGKEKEKAFENSDIFIHPTLKDCFPLVLLEAMQYSLPVISTIEGGIPDIVEDGTTGYLVSQENAEALAEKLEILIKNPELRQQMGKSGRKKYEKEFTLQIFEYRLKEILQLIATKQNYYDTFFTT